MKTLDKIQIRVPKRKVTIILAIAVSLLALTSVVATLLYTNKTKTSPPAATIQPPPAESEFSAADFVKQVYDARLKAWGSDEHTFISDNPTWFTQELLDNNKANSNTKPTLFCENITNKPERFEALPAYTTSGDKKTATVYLNGYYQNKLEVSNMPVQLLDDDGVWKIQSAICEFI